MGQASDATLARMDRAVGWRAVRRDWAHFVCMRGERGPVAYLRVLWENPSLWALWIYRYGYWTYACCPRLPAIVHKAAYQVAYFVGQVFFKVALDARADIHDDVWLAPGGNILVGSNARIGPGSFLHGCNTMGILSGSDVLPKVGDRVHVGPGTILVGPITVPDDTVIGANSIVVRSIPRTGAWTGAPVQPFTGPAERLIPSTRTGLGARGSGDKP